MTERLAHYRVTPSEPPRMKVKDTGWSDLAIHSGLAWDGKDRPDRWFGNEQALLVHTTGQGLPDKAQKQGVYPTIRAQKHYGRTHGCHMVNGYQGHEGGDLIQMAHEGERANGVGTMPQKSKPEQKSQHRSVLGHYSGSWRTDLPKSLVKRMEKRWPGLLNPLDILPDSPNSCAIHMECIPLTKYWIKEGFEPAFPGSYFTQAQYDTIAAYGLDLALRKQWPWEWWRMHYLLGHSDVTPISRHIKSGGWDPGALLSKPRFKWEFVIKQVTQQLGWEAEPDDFKKYPKTRKGGKYAKYK